MGVYLRYLDEIMRASGTVAEQDAYRICNDPR